MFTHTKRIFLIFLILILTLMTFSSCANENVTVDAVDSDLILTTNSMENSEPTDIEHESNGLVNKTLNATVGTGDNFQVFVADNGTVWVQGHFMSGYKRNGEHVYDNSLQQIKDIDNVASVLVARDSIFAIKMDGTVWAWGYNRRGILGLDDNFPKPYPVQIEELNNIVKLVDGGDYILALDSDGNVWIWGNELINRFDNSISATKLMKTPMQLDILVDIIDIVANRYVFFALKSDGSVWVYGDMPVEKTGQSILIPYMFPVQLDNLYDVVQMQLTDMNFYALKSDGTVWALGQVDHLGVEESHNNEYYFDNFITMQTYPRMMTYSPYILQIESLKNIKQIALWYSISGTSFFAIDESDDLYVFGNNSLGQLGTGRVTRITYPVKVVNIPNALELVTGVARIYVTTTDGTVWTTHRISSQPEDGGSFDNSSLFSQIIGLDNIKTIMPSSYYDIAIKDDGSMLMWEDPFDWKENKNILSSLVSVNNGRLKAMPWERKKVVLLNGKNTADDGLQGEVNDSDFEIDEYGLLIRYHGSEEYVTIPEGVTKIGDGAFADCDTIKNINISSSVFYIGYGAFSNCKSLSSIDIPSGVDNIGAFAFSGCTNLLSINVNKDNKQYVDIDGILYFKDKTKLIAYPAGRKDNSFTVPNGVNEIIGAFVGCANLTDVTIPDTVTYISEAFINCENLIIHGASGSYAETYAKDNAINFSADISKRESILKENRSDSITEEDITLKLENDTNDSNTNSDIYTGIIKIETWYHGIWQENVDSYILQLDNPTNFELYLHYVDNVELYENVLEIELFTSDSDTELEQYVNKHVEIRGTPSPAMNGYIRREIVIYDAVINE